MPQPAFHLFNASNILGDWIHRQFDLPFDIHSNQNRDAFLHGAIGPDMGFFPGAERALAELAHQSPTGDLIRCMLAVAQNQTERAFTYGWASHVLLDALVHPVVNAVAEEYLGGGYQDVAARHLVHVRLEIGLDLVTHRHASDLRRLRIPRVLTGGGFEFLSDAHAMVHGCEVDAEEVFRAHCRVARLIGPLLELQANMAYAWVQQDGAIASPTVLGLRAGLNTLRGLVNGVRGSRSQATAFLTPLFFDANRLAAIDSAVDRFHAEFEALVSGQLAEFPNYNVEDGSIDATPVRESAA